MTEGGGTQAVLVGASSGGLPLLRQLLGALPVEYPLPVLVVTHVHPDQGESPARLIDRDAAIRVKDAEDKEPVVPGTAYFAPPGYHMLVERDESVSLSIDPRVNWSRPSVDVLFMSAVYVWAPRILGIVLSGANRDGAEGVVALRRHGCRTMAQDPRTAASPDMPAAAIATGCVDEVLDIGRITAAVAALGGGA